MALLEADYLDFDAQGNQSRGESRIIQGVEVDTWGRPIRYHLWREHPGDEGWVWSFNARQGGIKTVQARDISHVKFVRRLRQIRGVPIIHGVIRRMQDIKDLEESELIASRWDSQVLAFAKNIPEFGDPEPGEPQKGKDDRPYKPFEMAPGMLLHTLDGEDIEVHTPSRPNAQLEKFRDGQIQMVAAGTGTRKSSISKNYDGTYSSQRQELVEGRMSYDKYRQILIGSFYRPVWRRFIDTAVLAGQLSLRGIDRATLYRADYRGPAVPYIDPQKEVAAKAELVNQKLASRQQVIRDLGNDVQTTIEQIKEDPLAASETPVEPTNEPGAAPRLSAV